MKEYTKVIQKQLIYRKISGTIFDKDFKLRARFFSILDIHNYLKCIIKNH